MFKDLSKERGLHDKYRSKRHVCFRSNSKILSNVSSFHLGHKTLHLSVSSFRSQYSTPNIHQAPETCSRLPEEAGVSHNNLFRRLPSSCLLQSGSIASNSNVVKSITVPGLSHKLDEINTVPRSVSNIPRLCHKLCEFDHLLTKGQSSKGLCSLQQRSLSTSNVKKTASQPPRNPGVLSACHTGSPLASKGSSNPAHTNPEEPPVRLQLSSISQSPVSSRANLVAKQFTQGQRQPCFSPTTESHNSLRCFNARLACHVSGQVHKRQMVQSGINPAHQPPGIKSSISCPQDIPQGPVSQGCSIEVGQLHGSSLSQQQRRHPLSSSDVLNSGNRT